MVRSVVPTAGAYLEVGLSKLQVSDSLSSRCQRLSYTATKSLGIHTLVLWR